MLTNIRNPLAPRLSSSLVVAVCAVAVVLNFVVALHLAYLWSALKFESQSEWDEFKINGVRVFVGLVGGYFLYSALAAVVGLLGALQRVPSYLRFYRDSTIVDIGFTTTFTVVATFSASQDKTRAFLCEQLSRQPEILRTLADSGLNFENCEQWFENAVLAFLCVMLVGIIMRLQFCIALSKLYTRVLRKRRAERMATALDTQPRRVLLLPPTEPRSSNDILVYAPVERSAGDALELGATEAWVSNGGSRRTGSIRLPIEPDEGLLQQSRTRSPAATRPKRSP